MSTILQWLRGLLAAWRAGQAPVAPTSGYTLAEKTAPPEMLSGEVRSVPAPAVPEAPAGVSFGLSSGKLARIMPHAGPQARGVYFPYLVRAMAEFSINTPLRLAAFLAQLAVESGELRYMEEIASGAAYEGRADLGNTQPGDGERFKGRGPIQLTGRANYRACGAALGLDLEGDPAQAATPQVGFRIAAWYWKIHGCNELADEGTESAFEWVTRAINGGLNGLASREAYYAKAREVLGA